MKPGEVIASRFELERLAGEGGMGAVWRARDRTAGELVALKIMQGAEPERFAREAALLSELAHPAIVRYVGHGTENGTLWVAMEWLEGEDLAERIARGPMSLFESLSLAATIARALAAVHACGVVHRDVKPGNILLVEGGGAKLLDFGIARQTVTAALTKTGTAIGTPGYMAPEQARGDPDVGPPADVFSLGCVLFECIARQPVFTGEHFVAILAKVLMQEAPRLGDVVAGVPVEVGALVEKMLAKDPGARPANGGEVAKELGVMDARA